MDAYQKLHSDPDKMPMRGRLFGPPITGATGLHSGVGSVAPSDHSPMLIEHLGYNPGELCSCRLVAGQYYDEADSPV